MIRNKIIAFSLPIFVCIMTHKASGQESGIKFTEPTTWEEILSIAKKQHKNVFIDVFATWCVPCKEMDAQVFSRRDVGEYFNKNFVSFKVQMDSTKSDNARVQSFRRDSKQLAKKFAIRGYPTYLFLNENGDLLYKGLGATGAMTFLSIGRAASDPNVSFESLRKEYQAGLKDYQKLIFLADMAYSIEEKKLGDSVSYELAGIFDKFTKKEILSEKILRFYSKHTSLIKSSDKVFEMMYENPQNIDLITNLDKPWAWSGVEEIIQKEEIHSKIFSSENKPILNPPNWDKFSTSILNRYPKASAEKLILNEKVAYYPAINDLVSYAKNWSIWIESNFPKDRYGLFVITNMPAWNLIHLTAEKEAFVEALKWCDLYISKYPSPEDTNQVLDTKACILYLLGRKEEAIKQEEEGLKNAEQLLKESGKPRGFFVNEYSENLEKMRKGLPLWTIKSK
ncbi:MAG: DUF255 domain-containing protein [Chitinophagaceae bacterium]|nr:MAG: DUF255 domain-containing protein [Chitinophagaceae bacterium]